MLKGERGRRREKRGQREKKYIVCRTGGKIVDEYKGKKKKK